MKFHRNHRKKDTAETERNDMRKKGYHRSVYQSLALVSQFGINILVPVFLCSFLGIYLDRKLGTSFLVVIFFFAGALAGYRNIYAMARKIYESKDKSKDKDDKNSEKNR